VASLVGELEGVIIISHDFTLYLVFLPAQVPATNVQLLTQRNKF
jgi:hypothetical protein